MTKEQVQLLRDAGISETAIIDRILQETAAGGSPDGFALRQQQPEPEPAPEPEKQPAEPARKAAEPARKADPVPDPQPAREDKILAAIEKLTGAIYNRNVLSSGMEDVPAETAADIIGKALRNN